MDRPGDRCVHLYLLVIFLKENKRVFGELIAY